MTEPTDNLIQKARFIVSQIMSTHVDDRVILLAMVGQYLTAQNNPRIGSLMKAVGRQLEKQNDR